MPTNTKPEGVKHLERAEAKELKLLKGWDITAIECLLIHRVIPESKRRAKLP